MKQTPELSQKHKAIPGHILGALADAFRKSIITIGRWIDKNDDRLTSDKAKAVFTQFNFQWESSEELESEVAATS